MKTISRNPKTSKAKGPHSDCPFCNILRDDSNEYWVVDLDYGSLFLNYNQSFKGRCLYVPFEHYDSLQEVDGQLFESYNKEVLYLYKVLLHTFDADLINMAVLGNKVRHTHWHLIPRYKKDANWGNAPWPTKEKKIGKKELFELRKRIKEQLLIEV